MLSPANLFRMMSEFVFILLGGVLAWLGLSHGVYHPPNINPRSPGWLGLGAALIYWGVRSWIKTARAAKTSERMIARVGGASLVLVGCVMLSLLFLQFQWVGIALALAGVVLALRGFVSAVLSLRTD